MLEQESGASAQVSAIAGKCDDFLAGEDSARSSLGFLVGSFCVDFCPGSKDGLWGPARVV